LRDRTLWEETSLEENHDALPSSSHLMAGQSL